MNPMLNNIVCLRGLKNIIIIKVIKFIVVLNINTLVVMFFVVRAVVTHSPLNIDFLHTNTKKVVTS